MFETINGDIYDANRKKFFEEFEKKFSNKFCEYDPYVISVLMDYYEDRKKELKKGLQSKVPLDRCEVGWHVNSCPIMCSPSFLNQLGYQIQSQIEEIIKIKKIHSIPSVMIHFVPFNPNGVFQMIEPFYFHEVEHGICYSYLQCGIIVFCPESVTNLMLWIRYYSKLDATSILYPTDDVNEDDICFEICKNVPDNFPDYLHLPDIVRQWIAHCNLNFCPFERSYIDQTYNPNLWITRLKEILDFFIIKNQKKEERRAKRLLKERSENAQKVRVEIKEDVYNYFPDVTFILTFNEDLSTNTIEELNDLLEEFCSNLEEEVQMIDVEKIKRNACEIVIDFGMCAPTVMSDMIRTIRKSELGINHITVS